MPKKVYKVKTTNDGRENIFDGTLVELIKCFSYTLEVGNSWNKKINRTPKTIKTFIKNLELSYKEKEAGCYGRTSISLIN